MDKMRNRLAATLVWLVVAISLLATFAPRAESVLRQLLPALMLILGYYFGQKPKVKAHK
jgi:hypothetical protein